MDVTLSSSRLMLWPATITAGAATCQQPKKISAASMLRVTFKNPCGTNPLPAQAATGSAAPKLRGLIQNPCGQNPASAVSAFQQRVAPATVPDKPFLTIGLSARSARWDGLKPAP